MLELKTLYQDVDFSAIVQGRVDKLGGNTKVAHKLACAPNFVWKLKRGKLRPGNQTIRIMELLGWLPMVKIRGTRAKCRRSRR